MQRDELSSERVLRLCRKHDIVAAARKRTRYHNTDRIDDADVQDRLLARLEALERDAGQRERPGLMAESDDVVAHALAFEAGRILREHLVATLRDTYELERIASDVCARAGIPGRACQIGYCLVVLCQKRDPPRRPAHGGPPERSYQLDLGEAGFGERLVSWAERVASNFATWAAMYGTILDEAERCEITTLRRMIPLARRHDDIADVLADHLTDVLIAGPPLEEMSLNAAVEFEPHGGAYVFQSPLTRWVRTSTSRVGVRGTYTLDPDDPPPEPPGDDADEAPDDGLYEKHVAWLAGLRATREVLSAVIDYAERIARLAGEHTPDSNDDAARFARFRIGLERVIGQLGDERRAFDPMLAYVLIAMRPAGKRRCVAILSLRSTSLDFHVVDRIVHRMRDIADGDVPQLENLVTQATTAPRELVPGSRVNELKRVRNLDNHRVIALAELKRLLDDLPGTVEGLADIAAGVLPKPITRRAVAATRHQVSVELAAVDELCARVFRRYALRGAAA